MKKFLFLFLVSLSSNSFANLFWSDRCAPDGYTTNGTLDSVNVCRVGESIPSGSISPKNCRYVWYGRYDTVSGWNYYACPPGDDWGLYDTDSDGVLNSVDSFPYDPSLPGDTSGDNGDCTNDTKTLKVSVLDVDLNGQPYHSYGNEICYYAILSETSVPNSNCKLFDLQGTGISVDTSTPSGTTSCSCDSGYLEQGESCVIGDIENPGSPTPTGHEDLWTIHSFMQIQYPETGFSSKFEHVPFTDSAMTYDQALSYFLSNTDYSLFNLDQSYFFNGYYRHQVLGHSYGVSAGPDDDVNSIQFMTTVITIGGIRGCANIEPVPVSGHVYIPASTGCISRMFIERQESEDPDPDPDPDPVTDPPSTGSCDPTKTNYSDCVGINSRLDSIKEGIEGLNNDDVVTAIEALDLSSDTSNPTDMSNMENSLDSINNKLGQSSTLPAHTSTDSGFTTFSAVNANFVNGISNTALVLSLSNIANIVDYDETSCPALTIDLTESIGTVLSTTVHCDVFEEIAPVLSNVLLIVYAFAGFRIFASS